MFAQSCGECAKERSGTAAAGRQLIAKLGHSARSLDPYKPQPLDLVRRLDFIGLHQRPKCRQIARIGATINHAMAVGA